MGKQLGAYQRNLGEKIGIDLIKNTRRRVSRQVAGNGIVYMDWGEDGLRGDQMKDLEEEKQGSSFQPLQFPLLY